MRNVAAALAVIVSVVTVAEKLRGLLRRSKQEVPPEREDGVAVVSLRTKAVDHPSASQIRGRQAWAVGRASFISAALGIAAVSAAGGAWGVSLVLAAETLPFLPTAVLQAVAYHRKQPGEPIVRMTVEVGVTGAIDAIAGRLRRAFLELGAVGLAGSVLAADEGGFSIEGGTGAWGIEGDAGYRVCALVAATDGGWNVTVSSMNYVPSLIQGYRVRQNVALVIRHLVA